MRTLVLIVAILMQLHFAGCDTPPSQPTDWTPVIATEAAKVTMEKPVPPAPDPEPDDDTGDSGQPVTGPLDTYRDAKELIRKGNELADRGKAILDAAEREGKVTVDVRLPKTAVPNPPPSGPCPGGVCPVQPNQVTVQPQCTTAPRAYYDRRPRLFGRWRR